MQRGKRMVACMLATLLLAGMLGTGVAYAGEGSSLPQGGASSAPQGEDGASSLPVPPQDAGTLPLLPAPEASSSQVPAAPPQSEAAPSVPGSGAPAVPESTPAEEPRMAGAEVAEVAEAAAEQAPEEWLAQLVALALENPAAAAALLNTQVEEAAYVQGLKAVLDVYYGEERSEQLAAFSALLDARAAETLAAYAQAAAQRAAGDALGFIPGEIVVVFEPNTPVVQAQALTEEKDLTLMPMADTEAPELCALAELPLDQTVEEAVASMQANPAVQYAQPNFLYEKAVAPAPNDAGASRLWYTGANKVDVLGAWELLQNANLNPAANQVRVAVIDSAIMANHPDLQATLDKTSGLWNFYNSANTGGVWGMPALFDGAVAGDDSHGTHVAGIIGATANNGIGGYGVASGMANNYIKLSFYNVFNPSTRYAKASSFDVNKAMSHAVTAGAKVINLSLGFRSDGVDMLMQNALQSAWNHDVAVVTAAGNDGSAARFVPGDLGLSINVINLTNKDYSNRSINPRGDRSNYGINKTISAPGTNIYSTYAHVGVATYANLSGTSMASPLVAGVVALVRYANPSLSVVQIHQIIKETAIDTFTPGLDDQTAWGCVNAKAAVARALSTKNNGFVQKGEGLYYYFADGTLATGWQTIGGSRYYFGSEGKASMGLCAIEGSRYYFSTDGKLKTGWQAVSGRWYYFAADGPMQTGWLALGSSWYYLGADGQMQTGWKTIGNSWYYFATDGLMATGRVVIAGEVNSFAANGVWQGTESWRNYGGRWCYQYGNGSWAYGWVEIAGSWYHFDNGGYMQTGWQAIGGNWYYLHSGGQMATGWLQAGGNWYYLHSGGQMATGWLQAGGNWYYLHSGGQMATGWLQAGGSWYYLHSGGQMATGWLQAGGSWYYLHSGGQMATGWLWEGNSWYYLTGSGGMATGRAMADGVWHSFAANGAWQGPA